MNQKIRLLILEDVIHDAELLEDELRREGFSFVSKCVQTAATFREALATFAPDVIVSDYELPAFDGPSALAMAQQYCPDIPFILISGAVGEERVIELLKRGATDCVLKQHLARVAPAVQHALQGAHEKRERQRAQEALQRSEEKFRVFVETTHEWIWSINREGRFTYSNPSVESILGYAPQELFGQARLSLLHPDDRDDMVSALPQFIGEQSRLAGLGFALATQEWDGTLSGKQCHAYPG